MRFTESTKRTAFRRQRGRCGLCGEDLNASLRMEAHHIHPGSLGGPDHPDNCVYLCGDCHQRVHWDGRYRSRVVAPRDYYPFFRA